MPVRFTCRLLVVRTESGKLKVRYGPLDDECERMLTVHGPEIVIPPAEELTNTEFAEWEARLVTGTGFHYSFSNTPITAALVEAKRTYEDQIPKGAVEAELFWAESHAGEQMLAVRVTNGWNSTIPKLSLSTECHYDAPQPEKVGTIQAAAVGGSESMFHPMGSAMMGDDLWPQTTAGFALDPRVLELLRSRVASLSTESYWIALRTDGQEFDRIPGVVLGSFLDEDEE
jgi:hypothetical protein